MTVRVATPADVLAAIPVVNAAFAIEAFLDGTRTDETRIAEMMQKGDSGRIVASVYTEKRGETRALSLPLLHEKRTRFIDE